MFIDSDTILVATPPGSGNAYLGTAATIDLNPDYGTGQQARRAPVQGFSSGFALMIEVLTSFAAGSGSPVLQIHAAVSGSSSTLGSTNVAIVGSSAAPQQSVGGRFAWGYLASQLTAGTRFFIRLNPWTASMGHDIVSSSIDGKILRYLGLVLYVPNYDTGAYFSAGSVTGRIVPTGHIADSAEDYAYPSGVSFAG